jgi:hypothetical protein
MDCGDTNSRGENYSDDSGEGRGERSNGHGSESDNGDDDDDDDVTVEQFRAQLTRNCEQDHKATMSAQAKWFPGQNPEMAVIWAMFKPYERRSEVLAKLTGLAKLFATYGKSTVENIDSLRRELHGLRELAAVYDHAEIVLHDMTRVRAGKTGNKQSPIQFIQLDETGLPLIKTYLADGSYESMARYTAFYCFEIPIQAHNKVVEWCTDLERNGAKYDLFSTWWNSNMRAMDLLLEKAVSSYMRTKGCCFDCFPGEFGNADDDDDDDEYDCSEVRVEKQKKAELAKTRSMLEKPLTLFQKIARTPEWNCVALTIATLKKAGVLTEKDVSAADAACFTAMDLMRLFLAKTRGEGGKEKWTMNHFVISKEHHVLWAGHEVNSAAYTTAMESYNFALRVQHQLGLKSDRAVTMYRAEHMENNCHEQIIVADDADDDDDSNDKSPLMNKCSSENYLARPTITRAGKGRGKKLSGDL